MTQPGWYPDPAGQPQTYRYWSGSSWSQETTGDPYAPPPLTSAGPPPTPPPATPPATPPASPAPPSYSPSQPPPTVLAPGGAVPPPPGGAVPPPPGGAVPPPPGGAVPPPPFGYGQQPPFGGGFPPAPPTGGSGGSGSPGGSAPKILLVVAAVLALMGLSVGGFFGFRALAGDDDDTDASDDTSLSESISSPTDTTAPTETTPTETTAPTETTETNGPTETATGGTTTTEQQCRGGSPTPSAPPAPDADEVKGGPLTIPVPRGYVPDDRYSAAFSWADDFIPLQKVIEQGENQGWVAVHGVGALNRANGFDDPAQAAEVVMTCMAASTELYSFFSGRTDLDSGAITVDGNDAFQITAELRVDDPELSVEGDVARVIVVDMGDPATFGLYISVAPIGDQKLIDQQEAFVSRIDVD